MLRATWLGGAAGILQLRVRRINSMYNMSSLRADDHSTIGALLGALLVPAVFWKRARAVHLFLGGAGIGAGLGLSTHWIRNITGERLPEGPIPRTPPQVNSPEQSTLTTTPL